MLLPRYSQIQSGCRVLFLPKNPTNPPVSASVEVTNICNSQENLKAVNDERDVGQIPATTYFKGEDMDFIEATPLPTECRCCQKTDCYNCDHASKRWTLSKSRSFCCCESLKKRQSCALNGRLKKLIIKLQWWRKQSDSTEARRTRQNTAWSCGEEDECEIWGNILSVALSKLWRASARH